MNIDRINFDSLGEPVGPYVHAVRHFNTLYTSGFTAFGSAAQHGSISEQAKAIFYQLQLVATEMSTSLDKLIKVTIFVTELADIDNLRDTLTTLYGDNKPASSLIRLEQLFAPELKIEVEAVFGL